MRQLEHLLSFPVRERGLKQRKKYIKLVRKMSFPVRERGLKQGSGSFDDINIFVVPRAGTWIETLPKHKSIRSSESFPVRERGLKPQTLLLRCGIHVSFPVRERGLKQFC